IRRADVVTGGAAQAAYGWSSHPTRSCAMSTPTRASSAPRLPLLAPRLVAVTALTAGLTVALDLVLTQVFFEPASRSFPFSFGVSCYTHCGFDGDKAFPDTIFFAYPTILLLIPVAYWLALSRLPDVGVKETAAVVTLLTAVVLALAQGVIAGVDLAIWPHYRPFPAGCGCSAPLQGF